MIYLDHAATTPLRPEAREAWLRAAAVVGNPASAHAAGRAARKIVEDVREQVAALLDAEPRGVVFTSGATEANNLAIFGLAGDPPGHVLASPIEHPCVVEPLAQLRQRGFSIDPLPLTAAATVDSAMVAAAIRPETRLVTVQLVNHEIGVVQPVREIVSAAGSIPVHTDAAQAVGKIPVRFRSLGAAAMTVSAHKFGGPMGIGALTHRPGVAIRPLHFGGHQQWGLRPGTESAALAAAMAAALVAAVADLDADARRAAALRDSFLARLQPAAPFIVSPPDAVPHIINVAFPGCPADRLLIALDLAGVACSTGSACSSGSLLPSPVVGALGVSESVLRSAMRFSLSSSTTEADVERAAAIIVSAVNQLRGSPGDPN